MTDAIQYSKGAFVTYEPRSEPGKPANTVLFRFNPESLTRTVALQAAQPQPGTEGSQAQASGTGQQQPQQATNPDAGATLKESFSVTIRVDADDLAVATPDGIAPEIAAIEDLLYPARTAAQQASTGAQAVEAVGPRPLVLFVWGPKRIVPVRIASLKIDETLYDAKLNPVRAEIEVSLEVLGLADAVGDNTVAAALAFTDDKRRQLAADYHATTSERGQGLVQPLLGPQN
jgi:Contractile injection system tube protein